MTEYSRADVVLVSFVFADETGVRRRPAVIVSSDAYHRGREEAIIAALTSRTDRVLEGDHLINNWRGAGLLYPSVATGIIRTIKRGMIARRLGKYAGGRYARHRRQITQGSRSYSLGSEEVTS